MVVSVDRYMKLMIHGMKKFLCWIALAMFIPMTAHADKGWIDLTSQYITNYTFDGNTNQGWTFSWQRGNCNNRVDAMEFWNSTFDIHQNLMNLSAGHYKLSVQSYFRCKDNQNGYQDYLNGTENVTGYLYAGNKTFSEKKLVSVYSQSFTENIEGGCWGYGSGDWWNQSYVYFPNNMESGTRAFKDGYYWNELEFDHDGGDLIIGLKNDEFISNNWCLFDNFKIEYYGEVILATGLTVTPSMLNLLVGEEYQLISTITPENATYKTLAWSSSNENIATVNDEGFITTKDEGNVRITARTTDGSNKVAHVMVRVTSNQATEESLIINEIMASNVDEWISPAFNFDGWIELYNPTDEMVGINNFYFSDSPSDLKKWRAPANMGTIPPHGYRLVWFDSGTLHRKNTSFKLDEDGGTIYISNSYGKLIAQQDYPSGMERVSYARTTDGGDEWSNTSNPTPGKSNNTSTFALAQLGKPVVDQPSQLFSGMLNVNVEIPAGCTLRYTTDGTLPTLTNGETSRTGQFTVSYTSSYRFRLFADDYLASPVTSRSYIYYDRDYSLPIVSVISDPRFLFDDSIGVYVRGVNGRPGNGQSSKCNWNMDWERPVNFSYITLEEGMVINQDVNLEMCGGWSRAWTPHSFKLKGSKELGGNKNLEYPFFANKPYIRNRTLQIRNGGNNNNDRLKDGALQSIVLTSGIDVDGQSFRPVHEFINGDYVGMLNVREPNNKHYVYANYGWDDDEIDLFEISPDSFYVQKCGTDESYQQLLSLSADAANSETYEEIKQLLDIDEYIAYMALEFYLGGSDWTRNNVKAFRYRDGGKYRFVMFDLDGSFSNGSNVFNWFFGMEYNYTFDVLYPSNERITTDNTLVTLFRQLLQNDEFKKKFIDTYCIVGGSVFYPKRCNEVIDSLVAICSPAMALEGRSGNVSSTGNSLKNSLNGRNNTMISALKNYSLFDLYQVSSQQAVLSSDVDDARIEVNGIEIPTGYFNGQLFGPVKLKAVAPAGYSFQGWVTGSANQKTIFNKGSVWYYYDYGSLDGNIWFASDYSMSNWSSGNAPLGYKLNGVSTTISYGNDSRNKYPTSYYRKTFILDEKPASNAQFTLNYAVDDGFVIYVNGTEVSRYNMPSGNITFNTYSSTYADDVPFEGSISIPAHLLRKGNNVIAVEVHNCSAGSSDIYWDAQLTGTVSSGNENYYSTDAEINMPTGNFQLMASYKSLTETQRNEEGICPVRINEVSGSNSIFINEYGKKNDWIELYNTTDEPIDVEGMYLTDNLDKPQKYKISKEQTNASTIIPPHGYLLVWCDKLATTNQALHASFKISDDGGVIALSASDNSWTDTLYYGLHDGNTTIGRYPDGSNDIYVLTTPTIEKHNLMTSYAQKTNQESLDIKGATIASSNGFRIRYGNETLILKSEDTDVAHVEIYTASGQIIMTTVVSLRGGVGNVNVADLPSGFYVARAIDGNGNRVGCKFMK